MKRKIYLTLGFISLISFVGLNIYTPFLFCTHHEHEHGFWMHVVVSFFSFLLSGVMLALISIPFITNGMDPFYFGALTYRYRKIYHSELGDFYMSKYNTGTKFKPGDTKVSIYHQGYLVTKELFELKYDGNSERFKKEVKDKLDDIYKDILKSKSIENSFDKWDGYLDKKSRREDILTNKLNIK